MSYMVWYETSQGPAMTETRHFGAGSAERPAMPALLRGWSQRCPVCGERTLFRSYLKVADACPHCGEDLHHQRADDAPPYFTIFIVGHIVVPGALLLERWQQPETWVHWLIWIPLTLALSVLLLPRVKGALVGLQWALRMHGFAERTEENLFIGADRR